MRVHRVIIEPTGVIEYRITDPKEPQPYDRRRRPGDGPESLDAFIREFRKELEADIRNQRIV